VGLLSKTDTEGSIRILFQLCDSDRDGLLTQAEITNVFSIFFMMADDGKDEETAKEAEALMESINDIVKKAFGDKTKVSEKEFLKICAENEEIRELAPTIHGSFAMALAYTTTGFS
jgi:hypothetical protein